MSSNISYIRATASCLPFIGPLVATYTAYEVEDELTPKKPFGRILDTLSVVVGDREYRVNKELQHRPIHQMGRTYALYGIAGGLLSVAATVGLIALGILHTAPGIAIASLFGFSTLVLNGRVFMHNQHLATPPATSS